MADIFTEVLERANTKLVSNTMRIYREKGGSALEGDGGDSTPFSFSIPRDPKHGESDSAEGGQDERRK